MKKFINPLLSLGTAAALLGAIYFQNQEIDSLKKQTPIQPAMGSNNQNLIESKNKIYSAQMNLRLRCCVARVPAPLRCAFRTRRSSRLAANSFALSIARRCFLKLGRSIFSPFEQVASVFIPISTPIS